MNAVQQLVTDYNSFNTTLNTDMATTRRRTRRPSSPATRPRRSSSATLPNLLSGQVLGARHDPIAVATRHHVQQRRLVSPSTVRSCRSAYASDPGCVQQFFTQNNTGMADQLDQSITSLAGQTNSVLSSRMSSISDMMSQNSDKITSLNTMLTNQRQLLYNQFYQMEVALSQMQNSMSIVSSLSMVTPTVRVPMFSATTTATRLPICRTSPALSPPAPESGQCGYDFQQQFHQQQLTVP